MRSCLVIKTSSFGDIFQTVPAILALKRSHKDLKVTWVVEKRCASALEGMLDVDELVVVDFKAWRKSPLKSLSEIMACIKTLRSKKYDLVLDFQANSKSALLLLLSRALIKKSFSRVAEWPHKLVRAERVHSAASHSITHNFSLVQDLVTQSEDLVPSVIDKPFDELQTTKKMIVMLGFGSNWPSKKINSCEALKLMRSLKTRYDPYFLIPSLPHEIQEHTKLLEEFEGQLLVLSKILDYSFYLKKTDLFVGVDSALLHLARLFNVKSIGYFGPSSAQFYGQAEDFQGQCHFKEVFVKRCSKLRSCSAPCMRAHFKEV